MTTELELILRKDYWREPLIQTTFGTDAIIQHINSNSKLPILHIERITMFRFEVTFKHTTVQIPLRTLNPPASASIIQGRYVLKFNEMI